MEQQCFGQKNWDILGLFILAFPAQLIENKIFRFQDWNRGSLVSEATVLPTDPQPLHIKQNFSSKNKHIFSEWIHFWRKIFLLKTRRYRTLFSLLSPFQIQ